MSAETKPPTAKPKGAGIRNCIDCGELIQASGDTFTAIEWNLDVATLKHRLTCCKGARK